MKKNILLLVLLTYVFTCHAQWSTLCGNGDGMIVSFTNYDNEIYATGFFTNICGTNANYIAKWDGTQWASVDTGLSDAGHRLEVLNNELYVAQYRQTDDSNWVLKWDGSHFLKLGAGVYLSNTVPGTSKEPNLYDIARYNGNIVASGEFDIVGDKQISGIMQWNGTSWDSLGTGLSGSINNNGIMYPHQLLVYNNDLYVAGNFTTAGGLTVNGIARWDGTQWHTMGAGFNGQVYSIGVFNNELYAGGEFTQSGSTNLQRIAKWDGTSWVNPGFGVYYSNTQLHAYVHTLLQIGSHLIAEGGFDHVLINGDTATAHSIISFDGTSVDTLDGGIANGEFEGLTAYNNNDVLAGGATFTPGNEITNVSTYHFHNVGITAINNHINIYPNPATSYIHLNLADVNIGNKLTIYNVIGQEVYNTRISGNSQTIFVGNLLSGIYFIKLPHSNGRMEYTKIIKE